MARELDGLTYAEARARNSEVFATLPEAYQEQLRSQGYSNNGWDAVCHSWELLQPFARNGNAPQTAPEPVTTAEVEPAIASKPAAAEPTAPEPATTAEIEPATATETPAAEPEPVASDPVTTAEVEPAATETPASEPVASEPTATAETEPATATVTIAEAEEPASVPEPVAIAEAEEPAPVPEPATLERSPGAGPLVNWIVARWERDRQARQALFGKRDSR